MLVGANMINEAVMDEKAVSELSYEQAFSMLESIVDRMSEGSVPLDELMKLYEYGMKLGEHCEKLLAGYEAKMERISSAALMAEAADLTEELSADGE